MAHIEAEGELEARYVEGSGPLYTESAVREIHASLYRRLQLDDRRSDTRAEIVPGALRTVLVTAGRHLAPEAHAIPSLLDAWGARYTGLSGRERAVVGAACAHHRLLWVHPFLDGNGRTARLHTHLVLGQLRLTHGLSGRRCAASPATSRATTRASTTRTFPGGPIWMAAETFPRKRSSPSPSGCSTSASIKRACWP